MTSNIPLNNTAEATTQAEAFAKQIESYIFAINDITEPIYIEAEKYIDLGFKELKANPLLGLGFVTMLFLIIISILFKFLGKLTKSQGKIVYFREESVTNADLVNHIKKFRRELDNLTIKTTKKSAEKKEEQGSEQQQQPQAATTAVVDDRQLLDKINSIQQAYQKNQNTLKKFIHDKNEMSSFLNDFNSEVSESHRSISKELNTLKQKFTAPRQSVATSGQKKYTQSIDFQRPIKENARAEQDAIDFAKKRPSNNASQDYTNIQNPQFGTPSPQIISSPQPNEGLEYSNSDQPTPSISTHASDPSYNSGTTAFNTPIPNVSNGTTTTTTTNNNGLNGNNTPITTTTTTPTTTTTTATNDRGGRGGRGNDRGREADNNDEGEGGEDLTKREISPFRPLPKTNKASIIPKKTVPGRPKVGGGPTGVKKTSANPFLNKTEE